MLDDSAVAHCLPLNRVEEQMSSLTPHSALVHTMVMASAIDAEMTDSELLLIG